MNIKMQQEESANLGCYFLKSILANSIKRKPGKMIGLKGSVLVNAGGMMICISENTTEIVVSPKTGTDIGTEIIGDLPTLLNTMLFKKIIRSYLSGKIKLKGSYLNALKFLWFIKG